MADLLDENELAFVMDSMWAMRAAEMPTLDNFHAYWRGEQKLPACIPNGVPTEVRNMAKMSRINVCRLVISVPAQSLFVDGYRAEGESDNLEQWQAWRANRKNAGQSATWRATFAYGASYDLVLKGDPYPVIRGLSPRHMTVAYGDDPNWPVYALEETEQLGAEWKLYDETRVYTLTEGKNSDGERVAKLVQDGVSEHGMGVCPVVRYRSLPDLDGESTSELHDIIPLQDQLDFTTFDMLVAQHYAAFRQRYVIGWTTDDENTKAKGAASRLWTFDSDGDPDAVKVGEFEQTDLSGYLKSREATFEHLGVLSQVPPHNLVGQMVNLSAEALVAAESSSRRKINELETSLGESTEQLFELISIGMGIDPPESPEVRWRDTEARSFAATVDALGKLSSLLAVPPRALWERIPDVTEEELARWTSIAEQGGELDMLLRQLVDGQTSPSEPAPAV